MADKITVEFQGLTNLVNRIGKIPVEIQEEIQGEIEDTAQQIVKEQKLRAPVNFGQLRRAIGLSQLIKEVGFEISCSVDYAAFVEFGTKTKVQIPAELSGYAAQFKGSKKGSFDNLLKEIEVWVRRNKIGATYNIGTKKKNRQSKDEIRQRAFFIAMNIAKYGVKAQPFFFAPYFEKRKQLKDKIIKVINKKR